VNLDIWYSIHGGYRPYHVPENQLYDYISYSKHKRRQLSDRLATARNKIQCNYTAPSKYTKPKNITPIKPVKTKDYTPSLISKFWNESCSLTPPPLPPKPVALMQCSASAPKIPAYRFERSRVLIDAKKYFNSLQKMQGKR
jgi:hypothetical protein